jgi:hypothetical protein
MMMMMIAASTTNTDGDFSTEIEAGTGFFVTFIPRERIDIHKPITQRVTKPQK